MQATMEGISRFQQALRPKNNPLGDGIPEDEDGAKSGFKGNEYDYANIPLHEPKPFTQMSKKEEAFWEKQAEIAKKEEEKKEPAEDATIEDSSIQKEESAPAVDKVENTDLIIIPQTDYSVDSAKTFKEKWKSFWESKPLKRGVEKVKNWFKKKEKNEDVHSYPEWDYGSKSILGGKDLPILEKPLWFLRSKITRTGETLGMANSFATRAEHARFYKEIRKERKKSRRTDDMAKKTESKERINAIVKEMVEFDDLSHKFLTERQEINVDMGELGTQSAMIVRIKPKNASPEKKPLVYVPGISTNVDGTGIFPIKLAMETGQEVIVIGHPESWFSKLTPEFVNKIKDSNNFEPHTKFFRSAIDTVLGETSEFDLCGLSAGTIITSELVKDETFNKRVGKISLIVPPGLADMTKPTNIFRGIRLFLRHELFKMNNPIYTGSIQTEAYEPMESVELRHTAYKNIRSKLAKKYEWWENENLNKGRKTKVILANHDEVTLGGVYGKKRIDKDKFDIKIVKGTHSVASYDPRRVTRLIAA
jgi:hypothetical protein